MSVIVIGNFDGVHLGHCAVLNMAIDISEKIGQEAIAFTFKNHPKNYFDKSNPLKLLSSNDDKEALIKKQGINKIIFQDFSSEFSEIKTPEFFLYLKNKFGCKHIVCGQNFSFGHDRINDEKTLKNIARDLKLNITLVPLLSINGETVSSTLIRTSLSKGNVKKAADMLGRSCSVISAVEHGRRIGSMMGFPTVNLKMKEYLAYPRRGVYSVFAEYGDCFWLGCTNIGVRPTITDKNTGIPSFETHLLSCFEGDSDDTDLYNRRLRIYFLDYIRDERKFGSVKELKAQISKDCLIIKDKYSCLANGFMKFI